MESEKNGRKNMELDDFKNTGFKDDENRLAEDYGLCITDLYKRVEESFRKQMRQKRYFIIFLLMLSVMYLVLSGRSAENEGLKLIAAGFVAGAVYLFFRYKPLPDNFYFLPLKEFVETAARRLKYFALIDYLVIIPVLIILGTGGGLQVVAMLSKYTDRIWLVVLFWIIFYLGLCIFGFFAGRRNWKEEHSGLLRYLERFRESL
jgi:hypothetical protein